MNWNDCSICFEKYLNPVNLSKCQHTFCRKCIEKVHPKQCPICRKNFKKSKLVPNFVLIDAIHEVIYLYQLFFSKKF